MQKLKLEVLKLKTLYITDLDGTFLNPHGEVSAKSREIINKMIGDGLLFTVATARSRVSASKILNSLNLNIPVILMNGVFIFDPSEEKYLSANEISEEKAEEVIKIFEKHRETPFMFSFLNGNIDLEYTALSNDAQQNFYEERKNKYKNFQKVSALSPDGKNVVYFANLVSYEKGKPLFDEISNLSGVSAVFYEDTYYDCWYLEVFSDKSSKPGGMEFVKKYTGAERTVAFGDNLNDIAMMKTADYCCAVSNGRKEVRDIADKTIGKNSEDAVAKEIFNMFYEKQQD